ncbi:YopX family protein [Tepidimicrobium xylanilyticum]
MKIKFRVWDKRNNRMIMPRKFATIKPVIDFNGNLGVMDTYKNWHWHGIVPEDEYELMLFTGILDKNEREIYEGDILKDTDNEIYYVDFIRGCFYLRTNYKSFPHLGWVEWLPMCEIDRLADPVDFEIVGNIYENPELLEG